MLWRPNIISRVWGIFMILWCPMYKVWSCWECLPMCTEPCCHQCCWTIFIPEIRLITSRTVGEDSWSLDALLKVVEEELRIRERSVVNPPAQLRKTTTREQATAAALFSGSVTTGPTCSYCGPTSCVTPLWNGEASRGSTSSSPTSWKMLYMPEEGSHIPELSHYFKMYNLQGSSSCEHLFEECSSKWNSPCYEWFLQKSTTGGTASRWPESPGHSVCSDFSDHLHLDSNGLSHSVANSQGDCVQH